MAWVLLMVHVLLLGDRDLGQLRLGMGPWATTCRLLRLSLMLDLTAAIIAHCHAWIVRGHRLSVQSLISIVVLLLDVRPNDVSICISSVSCRGVAGVVKILRAIIVSWVKWWNSLADQTVTVTVLVISKVVFICHSGLSGPHRVRVVNQRV